MTTCGASLMVAARAYTVDRGQRRTRAGADVDRLVVHVASGERAEHLRRERAVSAPTSAIRIGSGSPRDANRSGHGGAEHRTEHRDGRAGWSTKSPAVPTGGSS